MNRDQLLKKIPTIRKWDVIVIGGGASGLGTALDAASRGLKTLLLEKNDFAYETSSKSTKLIHGGIRYLRNCQFSLVKEALAERQTLLDNAPHLVRPISFILPTENYLERIYYYIGAKLYDFLSSDKKIQSSKLLRSQETKNLLTAINPHLLKAGGIEFFDAQFDDSRLAINLAETLVEQGGTPLNYMNVESLIKNEKGKVIGVTVQDGESKKKYQVEASVVINATGALTDEIRKMDQPLDASLIAPSQGTHIVLDRTFYPHQKAVIIPKTKDDRVLFIIPWHRHVLIGTTEVALDRVVSAPKPLNQEIDYLLEYSKEWLAKKPSSEDVLASFSGIRPLVNQKHLKNETATLSREHLILTSKSNLISVIGGKWTTYRKIGEDVVDKAIEVAGLTRKPSITKQLKIHGYESNPSIQDEWNYYGSDKKKVEALANGDQQLLNKFHPDIPCRPVDVIWAVQHEMARTVDDVLYRRTRCGFLNSKATEQIKPEVEKYFNL